MVKRTILFGLLLGMLTASSGCGVAHCLVCRPFGPGTACNPEHCDPCSAGPCSDGCGGCGGGCVDDCGPACGSPCEADCGSCDDACGETTCGPSCGPCGPLSWVFGILRASCGCHGGCGEIYWGDFHGDPPDCCDPCDRCGNYTGGCGGGCDGGCSGGSCGEMAGAPNGRHGSTYARTSSQPKRTAGPDFELPDGAKMVSQTDRVTSPATARTASQPQKSSVRQAGASVPPYQLY